MIETQLKLGILSDSGDFLLSQMNTHINWECKYELRIRIENFGLDGNCSLPFYKIPTNNLMGIQPNVHDEIREYNKFSLNHYSTLWF